LSFFPLRHLRRLIFVLILRSADPAQINNKEDEAQQPQSTPSKLMLAPLQRQKFRWT
jgi:hypothetical protein